MFNKETILSILIGVILSLLLTISLVGCYGVYGLDGRDGLNGAQGPQGIDGESCTTEQLENGALIRCGSNTVSVILNGNDGIIGPKGDTGEPGIIMSPGAYNIAYVIDPCGEQADFDELLLVLQSGAILAHYSNGNKQFLAILSAGTYQTTDGTKCEFLVDHNFNVTW